MSLTQLQLRTTLNSGINYHSGQNEYVAKLDSLTDIVTITELTSLLQHKLMMDVISDHAQASNIGSEVADLAGLKLLLAQFTR